MRWVILHTRSKKLRFHIPIPGRRDGWCSEPSRRQISPMLATAGAFPAKALLPPTYRAQCALPLAALADVEPLRRLRGLRRSVLLQRELKSMQPAVPLSGRRDGWCSEPSRRQNISRGWPKALSQSRAGRVRDARLRRQQKLRYAGEVPLMLKTAEPCEPHPIFLDHQEG